jgi:hypothetical protein
MAYDYPTVPDDKKSFFRKRLIREVSNFFVWKGLDEIGIPVDRIEHDLITLGRLMFFEDDKFGYLLIPASPTGYNIYNEPTQSRAITPSGTANFDFGTKTILYGYSQLDVVDRKQTCILLDNMLFGESLHTIIEFYATRMAMVWLSFDTNLLWQNLPPIISTSTPDTRLSIEKAINDIWSGKPVIVKDEALKFTDETVRVGLVEVDMKLKELFDVYQELYNDFKAQIGLQASAVDKQSGVTETESSSNTQHLRTALQVMLSQREKFCKLANKVYGLNLSVGVQEEEGGHDDGTSDDGTSQRIED